MSHKSTPSASESPSFTRTSVSIDEAVAMLLGWIAGPVELRANNENPSEEVEAVIDAHVFDFDERIRDIREGLDSDLSWANHKGSQSEVEQLLSELAGLSKTEAKAFVYRCAIDDELNKGAESELRADQKLSNQAITYITLASFDKWATEKYGASMLSPDASLEFKPVPQAPQQARDKPWLIALPDDPPPAQPWYTPARHFARQFVADDSTLLSKRDQLAKKVVQSLTDIGICKRGGKKPFDPGTVKKAFVNIQF